MTNTERIKAEIERHISNIAPASDPVLFDLLSFIESLEKEQIYTIGREVKLHPVVASNVGLTTFSIEVELKPSEIARLAKSKSVKLVIL